MTKFELWDADTANLIGVYPDEASARAIIREGVERGGPTPWRGVGLLRIGDSEEDDALIAESDELIARARGDTGPSSPPVPATPSSRPIRRRTSSGIPGYKSFGGYDFGAVDAILRIANERPNIADLLGPSLADAIIPRLAISPDTLVPRLAIPREVIDPLGSSHALTVAGLQSFGTVDWGGFFTAQNDRFAEAIAGIVRQTQLDMSAALFEQWSRAASEVARSLTMLISLSDGAILAPTRDPEKRFAYRAADEGGYLGGIDPESGDDANPIVVFCWWEITERLAS